MKRYTLEYEPLPDMKLFLGTVGDQDQYHDITGEVESRVNEIGAMIDQLEGFRKNCWRFIDREKNRKLLEPYIKRIEELEAQLGEGKC